MLGKLGTLRTIRRAWGWGSVDRLLITGRVVRNRVVRDVKLLPLGFKLCFVVVLAISVTGWTHVVLSLNANVFCINLRSRRAG